MTRPCGCTSRAVTAVDEERHAAWHAEVEKSLGRPAEEGCSLRELQAARGQQRKKPRR